MRSRAHVKSHPIHPSLIPFPFAFLMGAPIFDLLGLLSAEPALWATAGHLTVAGLLAGVLAAVPGIIDYRYSVPPGSSAQARAIRHALGNVTALVLFAGALLLRGEGWAPGIGTLGAELIGAGLLAYSGSLGGTLVTRNMIGVDHRYAGAGKWQEADLAASPGQPLTVGHADDLADDQMKLLRVNGRRLVLARTGGQYRAFDDGCTHRGGSLAGGVVIDGTVQCLWHGSQFDTATGKVACGPARSPIRTYEIKQTERGELLLVSPPS
jgi:nitrite reductase/ring-hydroxylating ferredoxin subunit/uncharacterized membrane protein